MCLDIKLVMKFLIFLKLLEHLLITEMFQTQMTELVVKINYLQHYQVKLLFKRVNQYVMKRKEKLEILFLLT